MKLLVTGHEGFVGRHLSALTECIGLISEDGQPVDLTDADAVCAAVGRIKPDAVIHLAAQAFVPESVRNPVATYDVNFIGTHHLLAALKTAHFTGRMLFVSTADVYGILEENHLPARETTPLQPLNPYAVSKVAAETLCGYWERAEGLNLVIARPFNHIGPGQSPQFAIADFSRTIIEIKLGRRTNVLKVGDLNVTRDFTDARDVVSAYLLLLDRGISGEVYNVCSGVERNLADAVQLLAELADVKLDIQTEPARFRMASQRRAFGSSTKLREHTGWKPKIDWRTSLNDTLTYWETTLR